MISTPLAAGDFDGDGNLDLALDEPYDSQTTIFFGNGDGTFLPVRYGYIQGDINLEPLSILTTRWPGQSRPALAVVGFGIYVASVQADRYLNILETIVTDGTGGLVSAADLTGDGIVDFVVVSGSVPPSLLIFLGDSDGGWNATADLLDGWCEYNANFIGDFNEDGFPDLIAQPCYGNPAPLHLFLGKGDGTLLDGGVIGSADAGDVFTFVIGDLNRDGHLDVLVNYGWRYGPDSWSALLGKGDGTFTTGPPVSLGGSTPFVLQDLDHDGNVDYVGIVSGGDAGAVRFALGNGDGTLPAVDGSADERRHAPGGGGGRQHRWVARSDRERRAQPDDQRVPQRL